LQNTRMLHYFLLDYWLQIWL